MSITLGEVERENLQTLVLASEKWAKQYELSAGTHAKVIRIGARLERSLRKYFRDIADTVTNYIDWNAYSHMTAAVSVEVVVQDVPYDEYDNTFIRVVFDDIALATAIGAQAGEAIYQIPLGLTPASEVIQETARTQVAELVGKKVKDGLIVDNPKAKYRISDQTRKDITSSISTSVNLGETQADAAARLQKTIKNVKRAELIAQTETVNAYQRGEMNFARLSGAVGHEWHDNGAQDICAVNTSVGPIPIDTVFPSGDSEPAAHPRCRCGKRYIYAEEWLRLGFEL